MIRHLISMAEVARFQDPLQTCAHVFSCDCCNGEFVFSQVHSNLNQASSLRDTERKFCNSVGFGDGAKLLVKFCPLCGSSNTELSPFTKARLAAPRT